ncbi:hypothetical protein SAMN05444156_0123 [Verrucomicrobium sp. GAS474]|uniref:hypothetical protein n=1 Tax=Verrucomicrobium sp. GAS474 TaxID=1882831 RepID=UPI00087C4023|nr:hypothetical protein [Verrucomicrobium sp. GAS474]SDT86083.1 hypothetical protein SAMN05444156_0123 [Verrucomicrobium sp. GAS474]
MNASLALLLAVAVPLWFFLVGLPWFRAATPRRWLGPLLGCFVTGWAAEMGLVLGIGADRVMACLAGATLAIVIGLVRRGGGAQVIAPLRDYLLLYLAVFPAVAWMLFPSMWHWTGDWTGTWRMGNAVAQGAWSFEFLSRTPLHGAAAVPVLLAFPGVGIVPFQIVSAAVAAAALMPLVYGAGLAGRRLPMRFFLVLALSPLVLLHTAAMWAKLLAAGCLVASVAEAWRGGGDRGNWRPLVWFWWAAAVAVHSSSLIYLPLLAALLWRRGERGRLAIATHALWAALFFLLLVVPYEAWVIVREGWASKMANNPAVYYRQYRPDASFLGNALAVLVSTVTGWAPLAVVHEVRSQAPIEGGGSTALLAVGYAAVAEWVATLASSLVGIFLLFGAAACARCRESGWRWRAILPQKEGGLVLAAVFLLIVLHTALSPYPSAHGMAQNGLLPFCLLLFLRIAMVGGVDRRMLSLWLGLTVLCGTLPYVAANGGLLALLAHGGPHATLVLERFRDRIPDIRFFLDNGWQSFATLTFPVVPLLSLAGVAWLAWWNPELGEKSK